MYDYDENKKVKLHFSIRDDFGNKFEFKSSERLNLDYESMNVFYLIKAFKKFLINAGYSKCIADNVTYRGATEDQEDEMTI